MERKVKKTNIKSVIDKKNNSAEGTDPDLNKRSKENATHHLNREVVILIENLVWFFMLLWIELIIFFYAVAYFYKLVKIEPALYNNFKCSSIISSLTKVKS